MHTHTPTRTCTRTRTRTHTHTYQCLHKSDFYKPGRRTPGLKNLKQMQIMLVYNPPLNYYSHTYLTIHTIDLTVDGSCAGSPTNTSLVEWYNNGINVKSSLHWAASSTITAAKCCGFLWKHSRSFWLPLLVKVQQMISASINTFCSIILISFKHIVVSLVNCKYIIEIKLKYYIICSRRLLHYPHTKRI